MFQTRILALKQLPLVMVMLLSGACHYLGSENMGRDPALVALGQASERVYREIMDTSSSDWSGKNEFIWPHGGRTDLSKPYQMDFDWQGQASLAVINLAKAMGYEPKIMGENQNWPMVRISKVLNHQKSIFELICGLNHNLRDQAAEIRVDSINRVLTLERRTGQ